MRYQAIIFDMDGVLLDTEPIYVQVWLAAAGDCGVRLTEAMATQTIGLRKEESAKLFRAWWGEAFDLERFWDRAREHDRRLFAQTRVELKAGATELVSELQRQAVKMAVATSTKRERAMRMLTAAGLIEKFATVTTGDRVANGKPAPDIFLQCAADLGVRAEQCLVIEDSEAGARGAAAAGMDVAVVPDLKQPGVEIRKLAVGVFGALAEVGRWLAVGP